MAAKLIFSYLYDQQTRTVSLIWKMMLYKNLDFKNYFFHWRLSLIPNFWILWSLFPFDPIGVWQFPLQCWSSKKRPSMNPFLSSQQLLEDQPDSHSIHTWTKPNSLKSLVWDSLATHWAMWWHQTTRRLVADSVSVDVWLSAGIDSEVTRPRSILNTSQLHIQKWAWETGYSIVSGLRNCGVLYLGLQRHLCLFPTLLENRCMC